MYVGILNTYNQIHLGTLIPPIISVLDFPTGIVELLGGMYLNK